MAAPTFIGKATAASGTGADVNQGYGSLSIQPGDILFILALSAQEGGTIGDITCEPEWSECGGGIGFRDDLLNNVGTIKAFYKIADGTESGTVTVSRTGSTGGLNQMYTQMYQFRGAVIQVHDFATNILGDGGALIEWENVNVVGLESTTIAFVGQLTEDPGLPTGYTFNAQDTSGGIVIYLECSSLENSPGGNVTGPDGGADGWATIHITIFNVGGYSFIPDH
jgi:hypothetical protein